ncbi:hypothetical protein GQ473_04205 [archaeon]|nr:hypothetical protein [archaeon]
MTINPYQVMLRPNGFFSIDIYDEEKFLDISISNIKPREFAQRIADELNIAFNDGFKLGQQSE